MTRNKYGAKKTVRNGIQFASKSESRRYVELTLLERAGEISNLELQPRYELQPRFKRDGKTIRKVEYVADFRYRENGKVVVEDVKAQSRKTGKWITTPVFDLKAKLLLFKNPEIDFRLVAA